MLIYINKNGQQIGPFDENNVVEMLRSGQLLPNDHGIRQGESQWLPLAQMYPNLNRFTPAPVINNQMPATPKKTGGSKVWLVALLGIGAFLLIGVAAIVGLFVLMNKKSVSTVAANTNSSSSSTSPAAPTDFTALKDKAEEFAKLSPPLKLDSKAKLKGKITLVEKGKYDAALQGFDAYFKEISGSDVESYGLTKAMMATKPDEIDTLVQTICTKGKMIGRYEGNIIAYANNCKVSLIDYRSKVIFAQKTFTNSKQEKSVSSTYDNGEYIVITPFTEIQNYVKSFAPDATAVTTTDQSNLPNIEDPKKFASSEIAFAKLIFPLKLDSNAKIKGKITTVQTSDLDPKENYQVGTMVGVDRDGNVQPPLPEAIVLTKESLGLTNEQIALKSSEIETLIQVNCKKGNLVTKVRGISVFSNVCTVSIVDYKLLTTVAQKIFESKTFKADRYSDPSIYNDKQDTVDFPRTEIEDYIKQFPKV